MRELVTSLALSQNIWQRKPTETKFEGAKDWIDRVQVGTDVVSVSPFKKSDKEPTHAEFYEAIK